MNTNITVNWTGKVGKRGLTETAIETLMKAGHHDNADNLKGRYHAMITAGEFGIQKELEMVKKFVRVKILTNRRKQWSTK